MWLRHSTGVALVLLGFAAVAEARVVGVAEARVVGIENGAGSGYLFHHRGNCYVIMPSHLHGLRHEGIRVTAPGGGQIGSARLFYVAPDEADLSLGLVQGGITEECGPEWDRLPRDLGDALEIGRPVIIERARQNSTEGREARIHTVSFNEFKIVAIQGEISDLIGGTSGATVLADSVPIGMVLTSDLGEGEVWALRMDEIVARVARHIGAIQDAVSCDDPALPAEFRAGCISAGAAGEGMPFEVVSWSVHPVEGAAAPPDMVAGRGPYIARLGPSGPLEIELALPEGSRLSRVRIGSDADGDTTFAPRSIEVIGDPSAGTVRRPERLPARDMSPFGEYDQSVPERFVRRLTIRVLSTWGGGSPMRIDQIVLE